MPDRREYFARVHASRIRRQDVGKKRKYAEMGDFCQAEVASTSANERSSRSHAVPRDRLDLTFLGLGRHRPRKVRSGPVRFDQAP